MGEGISRMAKQELLATIRDRYQESSKKEKGRILDEFIAVTGHHRKYGIRLLAQTGYDAGKSQVVKDRRIYDEAVRESVIVIWEAADRICGKRLKAALPNLVESMERHGHLDLDPQVRRRLLAASASTLDRLLKPIRATAGSRRKRRKRPSMGGQVPVRTFADWNKPPPGFLEIDFVVHCGGPLSGSFIHSLVATDVCTGWTEAVPLLAREQSLVVEGLDAIGRQLPFSIRGINSDNDSAFINETLIRWCNERGIEFTRSRAYRKNDQAWIEQKNGAVVRRFVGYDRYSGPVALLHTIREAQSALVAVTSPDFSETPHGESLDRFLAGLPSLWRQGEARPTHTARVRAPRHWRTREDPFEGVWCGVLLWLQDDPDATAKALLERLQSNYPDRFTFTDAQLRTLQRRV